MLLLARTEKMPLLDRSNRSSTCLYHAKLLRSLGSGPHYFSFEQFSACPPERQIGLVCPDCFEVVTNHVVIIREALDFQLRHCSRIGQNRLNTQRHERICDCLVREALCAASRIPAGTERKRKEHDDCSNTCADSAMCPFLFHDMTVLDRKGNAPAYGGTKPTSSQGSESTYVSGAHFGRWHHGN